MQCQEFEQRLNDLMDRRVDLDTDPQLTAHSYICSTCAETLSDYQAFDCQLHALPQVVGLAQRHAAVATLAGNRFRSAGRTRVSLLAIAIAASLLLVLLPWFDPTQELAVVTKPATTTGDDGLDSAPAAESRQNDAAQLPEGPNAYYLAAAEELAARQLGWVEPVKSGLRPVRSSMSAALNALWPTLTDSHRGAGSS